MRIQPTTPQTFGNNPLTSALMFLDTNAMANATLIDLGAMVAPRTYIDTKQRNKYAGAETFFREFMGTFIVCLSSGLFAMGLARAANKLIDPATKINPNSWFSNDAVKTLRAAHTGGTKGFVDNVLDNLSGRDGKEISKLTNKKEIAEKLTAYIDGKNTSKTTAREIEDLITRELKANRSVNVNIGGVNGTKLNTSLSHLIRDMRDMGRDIFNNKNINVGAAFKKIAKVNKVKTLGALGLASALGLTNQWLNRKITEKRTGKKGFVGEVDYQTQTTHKDKSFGFKAAKVLASVGIAALAIGVMGIKSPKDFIKKLEFTDKVTSGNAIKTVYTATLIGRFLASDNKQELGESAFRDYFGFLNWLVLGGFAAKGAANLLDARRKELFNIENGGKNWLKDLAVKSHKEAAAKGIPMWKINTVQTAGLAWSFLALGVLLPVINIQMAKSKHKKDQAKIARTQPVRLTSFGSGFNMGMDKERIHEKFFGTVQPAPKLPEFRGQTA